MHYNVTIWVEGASRPVKSEDWPDQRSADSRADQLRAQIKHNGWLHKVRVTPVVIQTDTR